jgi:hypothetical protein
VLPHHQRGIRALVRLATQNNTLAKCQCRAMPAVQLCAVWRTIAAVIY